MARTTCHTFSFLLIFVPILLIAGCTSTEVSQDDSDDRPTTVCGGDSCLALEHADTAVTRMKGLMGREDLTTGMLFHFEADGYPGIWMKNMKISIDILWLDNSYRIVHLVSDAPPCNATSCPVYKPAYPAYYVLEVPAGFSEEHDLTVGDQLSFSS